KEQPYFTDAPKEPISASELIQQQQGILSRNGENQRKRQRLHQFQTILASQEQEVVRLTAMLEEAKAKYAQTTEDLEIAQKDAVDLHDESTAELEGNIRQIDEINRKVRANLDKDKAETDASDYRQQYEVLTGEINAIRAQKAELLENADLPLEGLS